ncbi:MAG: hypothetical protein FOGNACKC_04870 [Anaerolineae bacterium]|nr:hypothetical protein [Anaerolineae bacterium]
MIANIPVPATATVFVKPTVWSKADLHIHTTFSDGYMTPPETIDIIARTARVNVVAITDHDTITGAMIARDYARQSHSNLEVIVGQEITTGQGDVVGLFLQTDLPYFATALEAIEAVHRQGGLAVAVHPFTFGGGMESVHNAIRRLPFDAVETRHGCPLSIPGNIWATLVNRFGQRLPALGNSDSHIPYTVGQAFTWFPGTSAADLYAAIQTNTVRPGGTTWKIGSMLRKLPIVFNRAEARQITGARI